MKRFAFWIGLLCACGFACAQPTSAPAKREAAARLTTDGIAFADRITRGVTLSAAQKSKLKEVLLQYEQDMVELRKELSKRPKVSLEEAVLEPMRWEAENTKLLLDINDRTYERIEKEVLTPEQVPVSQAYRLYFDTAVTFDAHVNLTPEQHKRIRAKAKELVRAGTADLSHQELYVQQMGEMRTWTRENLLTPEQLKKYAAHEAKLEALRKRARATKQKAQVEDTAKQSQ